MGSTGSGHFSDYSGSQNSGKSGGNSGGSSGTDRCHQAFSCVLEEVAQCDFFTANGTLPPAHTQVEIILNGRLFAVDANGVAIGALPTKFNYLAACIADGNNYVGVITKSPTSPVPSVSADFNPQ
ncbi:MAG: hypothetical protein KZQ99_14370 [Candidatus Thiodiazotropha sp. (ex Dulcina madagascariensis)]|nr:hypothetical protein [Candidatus Thiodiazotropha sp. (ex Dulcina madagascariensis)]